MSDLFSKLLSEQDEQRQQVLTSVAEEPSTSKFAQPRTHASDNVRKDSREETRNTVSEQPPEHRSTPLLVLPTRNEIEELTFQLRHTLKVKVQAEIPPDWQDQLDQIANQLKIGKLELYRFIIAEFLGKVKRKS